MLAKYRIKYNLTLRASHLTRWRFIAQQALTFGAKPKMWHMPSLGYQSSTAGAFQSILHRTVEEKPFYILCMYIRYVINIYLPSIKHFKIHFLSSPCVTVCEEQCRRSSPTGQSTARGIMAREDDREAQIKEVKFCCRAGHLRHHLR